MSDIDPFILQGLRQYFIATLSYAFSKKINPNLCHLLLLHSFKAVYMLLQDGPDILVCDEAHIIKNTKADVTHALKQVKCQRRIALTGSPLQNNLMEYYCVSLHNS